jgi:hypothetical protein
MRLSERVALWVVFSYLGGIALVVIQEHHRGAGAYVMLLPYLAAMSWLLGRR